MEPGTPKRRKSRRARPSDFGSIIPWGIVATVGDPLLLLAPLATATFGVLALLGAGVTNAPLCSATQGCAGSVLVPVWSLPPFDAYQDAGAVQLAATLTWTIWIARLVAIVVRAAVFGTIAHLAVQRARDATPDLAAAARAVRDRFPTLVLLELTSFGLFGIPLVLGQGSLASPGRQISQLGGLVGQILLINAFFGAFTEDRAWGAIRGALRWMRLRPLGHLALAVAATAASNGVFWLSRAGEIGTGRPVTLAVFAAVHALVATVFLVAFSRRFVLLYATTAKTSRRRRRTKPRPGARSPRAARAADQ
ncbi:MAG: hypothetical protein LC750_10340 [Actinobacteria bacterium]|nr:hypothetical protein [Actinomycetota bacterium]